MAAIGYLYTNLRGAGEKRAQQQKYQMQEAADFFNFETNKEDKNSKEDTSR